MERNVSQKTEIYYYWIPLTNFFIQAVEKRSVSRKVEEIMTIIATTRMITVILFTKVTMGLNNLASPNTFD